MEDISIKQEIEDPLEVHGYDDDCIKVQKPKVEDFSDISIKEESLGFGDVDSNTENAASTSQHLIKPQKASNKKLRLHRPCPYCSKYVKRFSEHLLNKHRDEEQIKLIDSTTNKTQRNRLFYHLRVAGIRQENQKRKGKEEPLRLKKSKIIKEKSHLEYQCSSCLMIYSQKGIGNHKRVCDFSKNKPSRGEGLVTSLPYNGQIDKALGFIDKEFLLKVVEPMHPSDFKNEILNDVELLYMGNFLFEKHRSNNKEIMSIETARKKLRYLAQIKLEFNNVHARRNKEKLMISEILNCYNWVKLRKLLTQMIYSTANGENVLKRGTASHIKYAIQHGIDALIGLYSFTAGEEAEDLVQSLNKFKNAYFKVRDSLFGQIAVVDNERRAENRAAETLPSNEEISTIFDECNRIIKTASTFRMLSEAQFVEVRRAVVTTLIFFNGRRLSDVAKLKIRQWELAKQHCYLPSDQHNFLKDQIGYNLLEDFRVIMTLGKRNHVPVIVPKRCFKVLDILADPKIRTQAGVLMGAQNSNRYLFPSTRKSEKPCLGSVCVEQCLKNVLPNTSVKFCSVQVRRLLTNKFGINDYPSEVRECVQNFFGNSEIIHELSGKCPNVITVLKNIASALERIEKVPVLTDEEWNGEETVESCESGVPVSGQDEVNLKTPEKGFARAPALYRGTPKKARIGRQFQDGSSPGVLMSEKTDSSTDDDDDFTVKTKTRVREKWSARHSKLISKKFKEFILGAPYPSKEIIDQFLQSNPDVLVQHELPTKIWKLRIKLKNTKLAWTKSKQNSKKM